MPIRYRQKWDLNLKNQNPVDLEDSDSGDHGVERSLSGGFSSGAGASAAPIGVLVGILRGCELSCCRISARTEDDFWHTEPLFFCGETKV